MSFFVHAQAKESGLVDTKLVGLQRRRTSSQQISEDLMKKIRDNLLLGPPKVSLSR